MWDRIARRLRGVPDDELEREIQSHLAAEAEERAQAGTPLQQARLEARRAFGNPTSAKEELRDVWAWTHCERWAKDLRLAGRSLRMRPGFFCLATMALAGGTGAASAMFAIVYATLLQPLPYPNSDRIVVINDQLVNDPASRNLASPGQVKAWTGGASSFEKVGAFTDAFFTITGGKEAERIPALMASASMLDILGALPTEGRIYSDSDRERGRAQVLVSEALWKRRFGSAKLNGQAIQLDDELTEIVGILPSSFQFLDRRYDVIRQLPPMSERSVEANQRFRYLTVLGRLSHGRSSEQASEQLRAASRRLGELFPTTDAERTVAVTALDEVLRGPSRSRIWLAMAAVCSLLVIACLNVGSLLLGRNLARKGEIALRLALGARRTDIFRQLACEALVLVLAGTGAGLVLAKFGLTFLVRIAPLEISRFGPPVITASVLAFTSIMSLMAAVGITLPPIVQMRVMGRQGWRQNSRGGSGSDANILSRGILLGVEVALAMLLIVGAGTAVRTLVRLLDTDPGFQTSGALALELSLSPRNGPGQRGREFLRGLEAELLAIPGLQSIGLTNRLPLGRDRSMRPVNIGPSADSARQEMIEVRRVSPGFFRVMSMSLIRGRVLSNRDTPDSPRVALVNQRLANKLFGSDDPVGRQLFIQEGLDPRPAEIVGVVNDIRQVGLAEDPQPEVYLSVFVHPSPNVTLIMRGVGNTQTLIPEVRRRLMQLDPAMPLATALPLTHLIQDSTAPQRFLAFLLTTYSFLALVLAAVGIYGVSSFAVQRRRAEIGIRIALGAGPFDVVTLVLGWVGRVVVTGMFIAVLVSTVATRFVETRVARLESPDLAVVGAAAILFLVTALLASLGPALSAALVDPAIAQRSYPD